MSPSWRSRGCRTEVAATESDALAIRAPTCTARSMRWRCSSAKSASSFLRRRRPTGNRDFPSIPAGVPSIVLTRRPDVAAAQRQLLAARRAWELHRPPGSPTSTLTASGRLLTSSRPGGSLRVVGPCWGIGALLSLPLFDGGKREAGIEAAKAEMDGSLAAYREQMLVAFREVERPVGRLAAARTIGPGRGRGRELGEPGNGAFDLSLSQRIDQPTRPAGRPAH